MRHKIVSRVHAQNWTGNQPFGFKGALLDKFRTLTNSYKRIFPDKSQFEMGIFWRWAMLTCKALCLEKGTNENKNGFILNETRSWPFWIEAAILGVNTMVHSWTCIELKKKTSTHMDLVLTKIWHEMKNDISNNWHFRSKIWTVKSLRSLELCVLDPRLLKKCALINLASPNDILIKRGTIYRLEKKGAYFVCVCVCVLTSHLW